MNINFMQTIITVLIFASATIPMVFGCTDIGGVVDCSASWLPPSTAALVVSGLAILKFVLKFFQGGTPGTALVAPMVPVVAVSKSGPGTVTAAQVASGDKK